MKTIKTHFLYLLFSISFVISSNISTYNFSFERYLFEDNIEIDSYSGNLYYNKDILFVDIINPINQQFIIQDNKTVLYYPDENKAVSLLNNTTPIIPFFHTLKSLEIEDFGLSDKGYVLDSTNFNATLNLMKSYWIPPKALRKHTSQLVLTINNNNIVKVESYNKDHILVSTIQLSNFIISDNNALPTEISFEQINQSNIIVIEKIMLSNIIMNRSLPINIVNFKLPEDIEINEVEW